MWEELQLAPEAVRVHLQDASLRYSRDHASCNILYLSGVVKCLMCPDDETYHQPGRFTAHLVDVHGAEAAKNYNRVANQHNRTNPHSRFVSLEISVILYFV